MSGMLYFAVKLVGGTLYPAYESFKAVKTRDVKEYVRWMTYWIVFSLLSLGEEVADIFLSWMPFYFVLKIGMIVWLVSPTTRGASIIYKTFVHPTLANKEDEIDQMLENLAEQSYTMGVRYARVAAQKLTRTVIETAIKGGGGLVQTLQKSYSMNDLSAVGGGPQQPAIDNVRAIQQTDELTPERRRKYDLTKSWHEDWEGGDLYRSDRRRTLNSSRQYRRSPATSSVDRRDTEARRRPRPSSMALDSTPEDEGRRLEDTAAYLSDQVSSTSVYGTLPRSYHKSRYKSIESSGYSSGRPSTSITSKQYDSKVKSSPSGPQMRDSRRRPPRLTSGRQTTAPGATSSDERAEKLPESPDLKDEEFSMSYSDNVDQSASSRSCATM